MGVAGIWARFKRLATRRRLIPLIALVAVASTLWVVNHLAEPKERLVVPSNRDVTAVQRLGRERLEVYMSGLMAESIPEHGRVVSWKDGLTTTAFRASVGDIYVYHVEVQAETKRSAVKILWGAVIRDDGAGNCQVLQEGPGVDEQLLRVYTGK